MISKMPEDFSMEVPRLAKDRKESQDTAYHKFYSNNVFFKTTWKKEYEVRWDLKRMEYTHEAI